MIDFLFGPFLEFSFMRRALVGCIALALGATPVGVFLTLRRMSLTGDAMAHAILPGAAAGYLVAGLSIGMMTVGGLVAGFTVAALSGVVARTTIAREDSSLAAFYLISLSVGVLIISANGNQIDLLHILFGSVLALDNTALILVSSIASVSVIGLSIIYRPLVMECVDPGFLRSVSRMSAVAHHGFLILVVLNLVGGFHALGTLMAVGIMILPAAGARFWARSVPGMIYVSVAAAIGCGYVGLLVSYHLDLPSGPSIILAAGTFYLLSLLFGRDGALPVRLPFVKNTASNS